MKSKWRNASNSASSQANKSKKLRSQPSQTFWTNTWKRTTQKRSPPISSTICCTSTFVRTRSVQAQAMSIVSASKRVWVPTRTIVSTSLSGVKNWIRRWTLSMVKRRLIKMLKRIVCRLRARESPLDTNLRLSKRHFTRRVERRLKTLLVGQQVSTRSSQWFSSKRSQAVHSTPKRVSKSITLWSWSAVQAKVKWWLLMNYHNRNHLPRASSSKHRKINS